MIFGESRAKDAYRRLMWGPWRRLCGVLPLGWDVRAHRQLGRGVARLSGRRQGLGATLAAKVGRHDLVDRCFETHFANQYIGFSFRRITRSTWPRILELRGLEHLDAALREGGVVVAHTHQGLPQLPLHVLGLLGYDVHQVGGGASEARLSPTGVWAADIRRSLEGDLAATLHDARGYLRPVLRALTGGSVVFTAMDGTGSGEELGRRRWVPVLGEDYPLPVFPEWLARRAGATLLTLHCWWDGRCVARIDPPTTPERLHERLDAYLREHPGDWPFWDSWPPEHVPR